jgi:hypothetical protein
MAMTKEEALRAYARMWNTLDASHFEPFLAEDFHYASQMVLSELESKSDFMAYIIPKLEAVRNSDAPVWAEVGWLSHSFPGPCLVVAQGRQEDLVGVVLARVEGEKISRIDLCIIPTPESAERTGEYPGLNDRGIADNPL